MAKESNRSLANPVPAIFGRRALAYVMDNFVIFTLALSLSLTCVFTFATIKHFGDAELISAMARSDGSKVFTRFTLIFCYLAYFTLAHWYFGRSLGKWAMGLTVGRRDLQPLTLWQTLARSLLYVVSGQLTLGLGFLLPLFRKDGLTLHDLIAGTAVVDAADAEIEPAVISQRAA